MRLLLYVLIVAVVAACRPAEPVTTLDGINIALEMQPAAPGVGEATAVVTLTDRSNQPISGATIVLRGDMTHAGMQPVLRETSTDAAGVYTLPFEWTMGGDWFVDVTVTLPDGTTATRTFDFRVES